MRNNVATFATIFRVFCRIYKRETRNSDHAFTTLSIKKWCICCCKQRRWYQQRNKQKTRKCTFDIKKPKNADVLTKGTKRNELHPSATPFIEREILRLFFVFLDRTGRSFVKYLLRQRTFVSLAFFVVKKMRYHDPFLLARKIWCLLDL